MELQLNQIGKAHFDEMSKIQEIFLQYIDGEDYQDNFQILYNFNYFDNLTSEEKSYKLKAIIYLINHISLNHHRNSSFFTKIENIINHFANDIKDTFSNDELFYCFEDNERILHFLFEGGLIQMSSAILNSFESLNVRQFFIYEISSYLKGERIEINEENRRDYEDFMMKRKIGENDSTICTMIRNNSIEEFVSYVNKTNLPLSSRIEPSIFETNYFLQDKDPTLIEYAAFCGSIDIFNYLRMNKVELEQSLWYYAIHSNNPELIHLLEDNNLSPESVSLKHYFAEAINCHHNEIANYISNIYMDENRRDNKCCIRNYNYALFDSECDEYESYIDEFVYNDYISIVKAYLMNLNQKDNSEEEINMH